MASRLQNLSDASAVALCANGALPTVIGDDLPYRGPVVGVHGAAGGLCPVNLKDTFAAFQSNRGLFVILADFPRRIFGPVCASAISAQREPRQHADGGRPL